MPKKSQQQKTISNQTELLNTIEWLSNKHMHNKHQPQRQTKFVTLAPKKKRFTIFAHCLKIQQR